MGVGVRRCCWNSKLLLLLLAVRIWTVPDRELPPLKSLGDPAPAAAVPQPPPPLAALPLPLPSCVRLLPWVLLVVLGGGGCGSRSAAILCLLKGLRAK